MRWTLCPDARGERPAAPRGAPRRPGPASGVRGANAEPTKVSQKLLLYFVLKYQVSRDSA